MDFKLTHYPKAYAPEAARLDKALADKAKVWRKHSAGWFADELDALRRELLGGEVKR